MKVLVLDIGTYSIKALYFEKRYRGHKLLNFSNTLLPTDPKLSAAERVIEAVRILKEEQKYDQDQTVVIYPTEKTTSRFVTLPFKDNKRISMALPLEIEEQMPFELDDILYEWQIVEYLDRGSRIFVTVTRKEDFNAYMSLMASCGLDPDIITTGTEALFSLGNYLKLGKEIVEVEQEGKSQKQVESHPVVIIDVGCTTTNIVLSRNGIPEYARLINYGGDHVTRKVMEYYELPYQDAERSKIDVGYIVLDGDTISYTKEQLSFSNILKEAYDVIIRDVNQTLASYKTEKKDHISRCFLAGAGWQTRNFKEYMTQELKLNIQPLEFHQSIGIKLPFAGTPDELKFCNTIGYFLGYAGKTPIKGINLKKDSKGGTATGDASGFVRMFKPTIRNVAIALVFFMFYLFAHSMLLNRVQTYYKTEIEKKVKEAFPDKDKRARLSLLENYPKLKRDAQNRLKMQKALLEGDSVKDGSSVSVLKALSESISKDYKVDVIELEIKGMDIKTAKMYVPDVSTADKVIKEISSRSSFKDVKQEASKKTATGEIEVSFSALYKQDGKD